MNLEQAEKVDSNPEGLPVIHRNIASAILITSDEKIIMGRKNPDKGGVYPNSWHIPGGGIEENESREAATDREVLEEIGLDISETNKKPLPTGQGATVKTLADGQRVWCEMTFNRFEVRLPQTADELNGIIQPGDDLVELRCFDRDEIQQVEQIPGGREFFQEVGYMD